MLNLVRYVDFVNGRRIILKMYYIIKRDCYIFGIGEKAGFVRLKRVTTIEVSL